MYPKLSGDHVTVLAELTTCLVVVFKGNFLTSIYKPDKL